MSAVNTFANTKHKNHKTFRSGNRKNFPDHCGAQLDPVTIEQVNNNALDRKL